MSRFTIWRILRSEDIMHGPGCILPASTTIGCWSRRQELPSEPRKFLPFHMIKKSETLFSDHFGHMTSRYCINVIIL
jgi:hypothetical protein